MWELATLIQSLANEVTGHEFGIATIVGVAALTGTGVIIDELHKRLEEQDEPEGKNTPTLRLV